MTLFQKYMWTKK